MATAGADYAYQAGSPHTQAHSTPATSVSGDDAPRRKPNILFILADQIAAPLLRVHKQDSPIKTPHIDKLAEKSTVFTSAYCPSPLCAPSRSSFVTGQLPTRIGAWDNAAPLGVDVPTYAHYLRKEGYETVLAGKMHFVGEQLHGFEERLTSDIYPGDLGWAVNWDEPDRRLEWYHNSSSIFQAGPCVRSNQLDFDEEVMFKSTRYLYAAARQPARDRPFCLTVSMTHPHDPYTIHNEYWDQYKDEEIPLPDTFIPEEEQDPHSKRLLKVCDLDRDIPDEAVRRARRAYFGAVSYVDDNVGKLLQVLKDCGMEDDTIVIFSADHGDMLGERGLWYKMSWFEGSSRVPLMISYPRKFQPSRIPANVSTLDILPTLVDLAGGKLDPHLPIDGHSLLAQLEDPAAPTAGQDTVYGEYTGEGTVAPIMMIKRGPWKFVTCPSDPPQLYNLDDDPKELYNLFATSMSPQTQAIADGFVAEAYERWDMNAISAEVLKSLRARRLCWQALRQGRFESWDYQPRDEARNQYIRSHVPLDELELRARFPPVDEMGRLKLKRGDVAGIAGSNHQ